MSKVAVRLDKDGTVTTYEVDKDGTVHPKAAVKVGEQVITTFSAVARNLASIQVGAVDFFILEAVRLKKKKKKHAKIKAKRKKGKT